MKRWKHPGPQGQPVYPHGHSTGVFHNHRHEISLAEPGEPLSGEYVIIKFDGAGNSCKHASENPYTSGIELQGAEGTAVPGQNVVGTFLITGLFLGYCYRWSFFLSHGISWRQGARFGDLPGFLLGGFLAAFGIFNRRFGIFFNLGIGWCKGTWLRRWFFSRGFRFFRRLFLGRRLF